MCNGYWHNCSGSDDDSSGNGHAKRVLGANACINAKRITIAAVSVTLALCQILFDDSIRTERLNYLHII